MMKINIIFGFIFLSATCLGQVVLTEIMYDPIGAERSDEFIEIYNTNLSEIDLAGWQVGDGVSFDPLVAANGNSLMLAPNQYGVIFDSNYFSDSSSTYDGIIPANALLLMIDGATFGNGGLSNSTAEAVILVNALEDTVQRYTYSLGNSPGFSDEKIDLTGPNDFVNWGESLRFNGTPGAKNSLTPRDIDLGIERFVLQTKTFIVGGTIPFEFSVQNRGSQLINQFEWLTFLDLNVNETPEPDEILEIFQVTESIPPGDSLLFSGEFINIPFGEAAFGLSISASNDEDSTNNIAIRSVFIDDPSRNDIVINEILFEPETGFAEWVEFYNNGPEAINFNRLHFADSRDTIQICNSDFILEAGQYIVLGRDSILAAQYSLSFDQLIINRKFPTLNNDVDDLKILGPSFLTYDRVTYTSDWYGRAVDKGTSLEKINPAFNGQISSNWSASVAATGNTPGVKNSIAIDVLEPENQLEINPNPFSPDEDGFEDFCVIQYKLTIETAFINIRIFDIRGRLIRFLVNGEPVASQGQVIWDGKDDNGRVARIGAYICFFEALNSERRVHIQLKESIILMKQ